LRIERLVGTLAVCSLAACKGDWIEIPALPTELVVHGVLTPLDTMQIVLLERTLTGAVSTPVVTPFSATQEPISSDGGVAERNAQASITGPDGTTYEGHEVSSCHGYTELQIQRGVCNGTGAGVYKFYLKGASLQAGGTYRLRVTTATGEVATAETVFPAAASVATTTPTAFNRDSDTLALAWPATQGTQAYQVRIETPFGAWLSFTDSTRIALTGVLRNPDDPLLSHVFLPGFRQLVTVSAVDANIYDYYRTTNNSFVGYGAVTRVRGARGVFGSMVTLIRENVTVTSSQAEPIEGVFDAVSTGLGYVYGGQGSALVMSLFIESPSTRKGQADALTGSYYASPNFPSSLVGTSSSGKVTVVYLRGQSLSDTVEVLRAELRGDTISGLFSKGAPAKYVRRK
jgi:hypothetical protein